MVIFGFNLIRNKKKLPTCNIAHNYEHLTIIRNKEIAWNTMYKHFEFYLYRKWKLV